nr:EAL domain-containing protein [uncultured Cetobacterium sp.]
MKFLLVFFTCFIYIFSNDIYIPKNIKEKNILEKYRDKQLTLGLLDDSYFISQGFEKDTFNFIIEDLFKNYLKLNIITKSDYWKNIKNGYDKNEIDIFLLTPTPERKKFSTFSDSLFTQNLYIASKQNHFCSIDDLSQQKTYVLKNSIQEEYFNHFLLENDIETDLVDKNNTSINNKDFIVSLEKESIHYKNKIKIGTLPGVAIAVHNEYSDLMPIINNALSEKYKKEINDYLEDIENNVYKENFYNSLTSEEKKYLNTLKPLNILLENDLEISHFSKNYNKPIGSLVFILNKISDRTGIQFNIIKNKNLNWENIVQNFFDEKIDILPLAKTKERLHLFNFTNKIDYISTYKINNLKSKSNAVGVIKDTIEESLVKKYYIDKNIKIYSNKKYLKNGLKNGEIKTTFLFSYNDLNMTDFEVEMVDDIPVYLALNKNNKILTSILNKAIANSPDIGILKKEAQLIRDYDKFLDTRKKDLKLNFIKFVGFLSFILFLIALIRLAYQLKLSEKLKKDFLTGLPSRSEFNAFKINNVNKLGYVILIDVDSFKEINDKYGHDIGDEVIIRVSKIIKSVFPIETSFRISGDEFYIFLESHDISTYLKDIKTKLDFYNAKNTFSVSLSIGYYHRIDEYVSFDNAFRYADMAMYESKKRESEFFFEATDELILKTEREIAIKTLLREASLDNIFAVYQPKFDINTKKIIGAEALARWTTKEMGSISPGEFIPLAESIKRVHLIDFKIAEQAIKTIKKWKSNRFVDSDFKISFNISMETFEKNDIVEILINLLKKYDVPGEWIEIEVTESILSSNLNKTLEKLQKIKGLKIQISIDDFTAGHSTASLLLYLPISIVKFDKSILDIVSEDEPPSQSIYKNLITLVKDLNLKIVAEGIETEYQLNFLKNNHVDMGQGFIFSKPISEKEFEYLLRRN